MRGSVYESDTDAKQKQAMVAYAKAEGIRMNALIIDGLTDHLRTQPLDDEAHVQRAVARIRHQEIPLTEDGIRAQVAEAVEMARKDSVIPRWDDDKAYDFLTERPLYRYIHTATAPKNYHRPRFVEHLNPYLRRSHSIHAACGQFMPAGAVLTNRLPTHLDRCPKCFKEPTR